MKIYIDTNVYLDWCFNRDKGFYVEQILTRAVGCEFHIVISDLLLRELRKFVKNPDALLKPLEEKCLYVESTKTDVRLARSKSIHFPDSLHLVLAEREQCDYLITNDGDFLKFDSDIPIIPSQAL